MTPEQYQRVRLLFDEALNRPEADRVQFLQVECAEDAETLRHVERLLRAHGDAQSFLQEDQQSEKKFGRYRITETIGRGAMGIVYGAHDPAIHRQIAIKVIQLQSLAGEKDGAFLRERLFREAHMAGLLSHPGIVTIFDLGEYEGQTYIAMERIWGPSLQTVLDSGVPLTRAQCLDILHQIASALDYAHEHRVVHRDVKPANILLQDGRIVKVVDFGIAKIVAAQEQSRTGLGVGTPSYMSPEQIEVGPIDGRSDQFSLAVIAFEMLTGSRPFKGDSPASVLHSIVYGDRPSAHVENSKLPARVDGIFLRALNKRSEDRYSSCGEFVNALESALYEARAPRASGTGKRRKRVLVARLVGACVVLVALALGALLYKWQTPPPPPPPPPDGRTISDIPPRAIVDLLRMAASAGDSSSMIELGDIYSSGVIADRDDAEAARWYQKAADTGNPQAMVDLGGMYSLGAGVAQDYKAAARWFQAAADAGNPSAMFDLGWLYERGQGVPKSLETAAKLYRQAAALGNDEAKRQLAQMAGVATTARMKAR
jgi:serine/threonine-protein kinase